MENWPVKKPNRPMDGEVERIRQLDRLDVVVVRTTAVNWPKRPYRDKAADGQQPD